MGTHPGFGRVIAIRWFEMLVGVLLKQIAIALTLSVLLYCYTLIMGTSDTALPWALKIMMIALVTVAVFIYRKPFQHLFSAVGYGVLGSDGAASGSLREATFGFRRATAGAVGATAGAVGAVATPPGVAGSRGARWARRFTDGATPASGEGAAGRQLDGRRRGGRRERRPRNERRRRRDCLRPSAPGRHGRFQWRLGRLAAAVAARAAGQARPAPGAGNGPMPGTAAAGAPLRRYLPREDPVAPAPRGIRQLGAQLGHPGQHRPDAPREVDLKRAAGRGRRASAPPAKAVPPPVRQDPPASGSAWRRTRRDK